MDIQNQQKTQAQLQQSTEPQQIKNQVSVNQLFTLYHKLKSENIQGKLWFYKKSKKDIFGPFTSNEMDNKLKSAEFSGKIKVCYGKQNKHNMLDLNQLIKFVQNAYNPKIDIIQQQQNKPQIQYSQKQYQIIIKEQQNKEQKVIFKTKQKGQIFLHLQGKKKLVQFKLTEIPFSKNFKSYSQKTIKLLEQKKYKKCWVILPGYFDRQHKNGHQQNDIQQYVLTDMQLVLTGRLRKDQSAPDATVREIREQIGLEIQVKNLQGLEGKQLQFVSGSGQMYRHKVYPSVAKPANITPNKIIQEILPVQDIQGTKSVQTWLLIQNIEDIKIFQRKKSIQDNAGKIIGIMRVKYLVNVLKQFVIQENQATKWKRKQRKQLIQENKEDIQQQKIQQKKQQQKINEDDNTKEQAKKQQKQLQIWETEQGSTRYKQQLDYMIPQEIDLFIDEHLNAICDMAVSKYGKLVLRRLFRVSNTSQRERVYMIINPNLTPIVKRHKGSLICQSVIGYIARNKQNQIIKTMFQKTMQNFEEIAFSKYGNHFIANMIDKFPIDLILKIKQPYLSNLQIFKKLIMNQNAVIVMRAFLYRIQQYDTYQQTKLKQFMLQQFCKVFEEAIYSNSIYFLHAAYQILQPNQLQGITNKIIQNFVEISKSVDTGKFLEDCIQKYWKGQFYTQYFQKINELLSQKDLKEMYKNQFANWALWKIIELKEYPTIKMRIANIMFSQPISTKFHPRSKQRWKQTIKKWIQTHHKINEDWVPKNK